MNKQNKVAIVTGGGTGIGRAASLKLAKEGCFVAVVYSRSAADADETVNLTLAPEIRVNCIAPDAVDTRWWSGHEEKMRKLSGALPLERISTPEDIAESIYLLLTSPSITGQILRAENGQTL
jgi:3-oxoacyl-[acyl-carrier protein] reductase